jgi:hypothetical protein
LAEGVVLDDPALVGVGHAVLLPGDEGAGPVEVQCCRVPPGGTGLVVTGWEGETLEGSCVGLVRYVDVHAAAIDHRLKPQRLAKPGYDLHLHLDGLNERVRHKGYTAAALVSLVSLLLGRRPVEGTVAIGDIDGWGGVVPAEGAELILATWVEDCRQLGIRRIIVPATAVVEVVPGDVAVDAGWMPARLCGAGTCRTCCPSSSRSTARWVGLGFGSLPLAFGS